MAGFDSPSKNGNSSRNDLSTCSYLSETYDLLEAPMQPLDKKQQTRLWQQNQYLADSGIQSALTTHAPSINSKLSIEEIEPDESILSQASGPYVPAWSSSGPMSAYPSESCLLSPGTPSAGSVIGMEPGNDVTSLTCSRSDPHVDPRGNKFPDIGTDEAESAIPELVRLIKDEDDQVVIYQASTMVFQLSKSEAIDALIQSKEMISCILSALNRTDDPETVRFLAGTLYNMSQTQTGLKEIFLANCVPCLVSLLNSPVESVLFYAITTLHNLLLHQEGAKAAVRQSGCLQKLTSLLQKNNIKFLTICTDCLQILALGHQESKLQILSGGGPTELIRILNTYQYEKLLWTTARVLKVLSVCTANKPVIIEEGGMEALSKHLLHISPRLVLNCLWTLRNLSDAATKLNDLQPLLHTLVQLLGSNDLNIVTCAAGILSNLTCNNSANKLIVYRRGGLRGLLHALGHSNAKEEILEPCMCALRHLTGRHEEEEKARYEFVSQLGGLGIVAHILHAATAGVCPELGLICQPPQNPLTSWTLIKAIVGLLRNLSMNTDNHRPMLESGIVSGLTLLIYAAQYEISKRKVVRSSNPPASQGQTIVQNVRLEEVVEAICFTMHMLAREPGTRLHLARFRAPNLNVGGFPPGSPSLSIFLMLLCSPRDCIQRVAAGVLVELSQDPESLEIIASCIPSVSTRLEELTRSRNEAVASYASALLLRLSEERRSAGSPMLMPLQHLDPLNTPPPSQAMTMDTGCPSPTDFASPHMQPPPPTQTQPYPPPLPPQQPYTRYPLPNQPQPYGGPHNQPAPMEPPAVAMSPPPGSLMAMVGPPPPAYGCAAGSPQQQQTLPLPQQTGHPHCYQQAVNEGGYSPCWNSYGSDQCPDSSRIYGTNPPPPPPHCEQMYSGYPPPPTPMTRGPPCPAPSAYGSSPVGYYPPCAPSGHIHLRGNNGGCSDQPEYMDQQAPPPLPPETCVPMTSPIANPKQHTGCFSMDTSGYASPCSEKNSSYICAGAAGGIPPQTQSRQNPSSSSVNSLQPLPEVHQQATSAGSMHHPHHHQQPTSDEFMSVDEGRKPGVGGATCSDRWFSSAHMCLP
uniref:Catenin beta n=1 Tax=Schistocephalus solidus TaxID=70667 RepID=A0A0X3PKH1_SCHSO